jgi:small subunit ribosomal protein S15
VKSGEKVRGGMIDTDTKSQIIRDFQLHEGDTGSTEVQVALLTERIRQLTDHLRQHHTDVHSRIGLLKLVGQRRSLLNYLTREDVTRYRTLITRLGLRR